MSKSENKSLFIKKDFNQKITNQKSSLVGLDFFSYFVHELKSPLLSLKYKIEKLKNVSQSEINKTELEEINQSLDLTFQFIEDALNMKYLDSHDQFQLEWVSLKQILLKSFQGFKEQLLQKQIEWDLIGIEDDLQIHADSRWIHDVFNNLIINAIQHSPEKTKIKIKAQVSADKTIKVSIIDAGSGVDASLGDQVFHPFKFYRKTHISSVFKGTGLGLHIAKSIIQKHGGDIGIEQGSEGCTFFFTLPQARSVNLSKVS